MVAAFHLGNDLLQAVHRRLCIGEYIAQHMRQLSEHAEPAALGSIKTMRSCTGVLCMAIGPSSVRASAVLPPCGAGDQHAPRAEAGRRRSSGEPLSSTPNTAVAPGMFASQRL